MHLNTTSPTSSTSQPARADLTSPAGLLPLKQLKRRAAKIEATQSQYREKLPLVLAVQEDHTDQKALLVPEQPASIRELPCPTTCANSPFQAA